MFQQLLTPIFIGKIINIMFKKTRIKNRSLKKYFTYSLIIINIISLYFMYNFINYYLTKTFNAQAEDLVSEDYQKTNTLNTRGFNEIIKNIEEKTSKKEIPDKMKNIFN